MPPEFDGTHLHPDWPAPPGVRALMSTRAGGAGVAPFDSYNLARDSADPAVAENRRRFEAALGAQPRWLHQVHGATVVRLDRTPWAESPRADASVSTEPGLACVVFAADCLPVLFCTDDGQGVAAAHAGWRGLAAGVLARTVEALCAATGAEPGAVQAWLGPCIGPRQFEVGPDVLEAFGLGDEACAADGTRLFTPREALHADGRPRWLAHLPALAREQLRAAGVQRTSGGRWCTVEDRSRFFSFRRDARLGPTGRMAAAVARVG